MQSSLVQQSIGDQEICLEVSGFSNRKGLDVVFTLDPSLLECRKCAQGKVKKLPSTVCQECEKKLNSKADTILQVTSEFLEQLNKTKLKLIEAEKLASKYLEHQGAHSIPSTPTIYRSVSSLYIPTPDCPTTPDSAFFGSEFAYQGIQNFKSVYVFQDESETPTLSLDKLRTLSQELSDENTELCDELVDTKLKIADLRRIAHLLKSSLKGESLPDQFGAKVVENIIGSCSETYSVACHNHSHCTSHNRLNKQLMRIVLNNFEATIMEMLEKNKHLFDRMKAKYRDEVDQKSEIAFATYQEVWKLFNKLSDTMQGIICSVLYLVSRALDTWILFSWGFIAWAWPTLVIIAKRLLEKLYPRISAIKAFVASETFCAFTRKWNEGQSLASCFKELETEAFLSTVCRISVSFVSVYMSLPDYAT